MSPYLCLTPLSIEFIVIKVLIKCNFMIPQYVFWLITASTIQDFWSPEVGQRHQIKEKKTFNPKGHSSALFLDFQVLSYRSPLTAQPAVIGYFKSRRPKDPEHIHIV